MDNNSVFEMFQSFIQASQIRAKIKIPLDEEFQNQINFMEYLIRCTFQKGAKVLYKHRKPKKMSDQLKAFERAFRQLNQVQKLLFYNKTIFFLDNLINQNFIPPQTNPSGQKECKIFVKGSIGWKPATLKLNSQKNILCTEKQGKVRVYDIQNYLFRNSKTSDYNSLVLQGISSKLSSKALQIHLGFKDIKLFRQWHKLIKTSIEFVMWQNIKKKIYPLQLISLLNQKIGSQTQNSKIIIQTNLDDIKLSYSTIMPQKKDSQQKISRSQSKRYSLAYNEKLNQMQQSQCQSIQIKTSNSQWFSYYPNREEYQKELKEEVFGQLLQEDVFDNQIQASQCKNKINIFEKLFPDYNLNEISKIQNFEQVFRNKQETILILKQKNSNQRLKMFLQIKLMNRQTIVSKDQFINLFSNTQHFDLINHQIQEMNIKTLLNSENSAIIYQKNKQFNRLYRSRDLVLIRHVFQIQGKIFIVDKSIQNNNIPPFTTIVRAEAQVLNQIQICKDKINIVIDFTMKNEGYLKEYQQLNLNIKYLKGFQILFEAISKIKQIKINSVFSTNWIVKSKSVFSQQIYNQKNQSKYGNQSNSLQQSSQQNQQKLSFPIEQHSDNSLLVNQLKLVQKMEQEGQIQQLQQSNQISKINRQTNDKDQVIIYNHYLFYKHNTKPFPLQPYPYQFLQQLNGQNPMWLGDWRFPEEGGLIFINKKKIQDQKNVLKFILSQVAKNVLSGKSIMNVSLPVDIFSSQSNLQSFLYSLSQAPFILQPIVKQSDLEKFVYSVAFGISISPVYLAMQKPFNPIIGQTFQCYIQGCPGYAQQISHHPPISSILFYGRGYQISAQLQAKMKLNINSGTGSNQGIYKIIFDDGYDVSYISPSGEVSGLAYGDRKFNIIQKCYAWSKKSQMFIEVVFNPNKKGFFGKQQVAIDYMEGKVLKVKQQFLSKLTKSKHQYPKKHQIIQELGLFNGNWNKQMRFENKILLDFDKNYPLQLKYQNTPIPSDSNWREDIHYRRILSISKAQIWKQNLEILQRNDKKLREQYNKSNRK